MSTIEAVEIARVGLARVSDENEWGIVVMTTAVASFALLADDSNGYAEAETAVRLARRLGNPSLIVTSQLVSVVITWRGDPVRAARVLDECIALTYAGAGGPTFGHILAIRSVLFALEGNPGSALTRLREAIRFSHDKGDLPMLSVVFNYGLEALELLGEDTAGALYAGCAMSPLMTLVGNVPPQEVPNRDRAVEALRARLGVPAFDATVARVGALPPDEAVTLALAALDDLLAAAAG